MQENASVINFFGKRINVVDLTHSLCSSIPSYEIGCGFQPQIMVDYDQGFRVERIEMRAGIGTHIDAPAHFVRRGKDIASLALQDLVMIPACVIDVSAAMHSEYLVMPEDIADYEKKFGAIPKNALVIFHTGWSQYWLNGNQYRNEDTQGIKHFPAVAVATVHLLLQRPIAGIAIDTLSPDSTDLRFPVHHLLLGNGKYIIENIAHANLLPPTGAQVLVLPLKIAEGTESPVRIIGLIP